MKRRSAREDAASSSSRSIPLTSHRALLLDILHFARQVPVFPVERTFDLAELAARREVAQPRIAWSVLFLKALRNQGVIRDALDEFGRGTATP